MNTQQLDLFTIGTCSVDYCDRPATHRAVGAWVREYTTGTQTGRAVRDCCLPHANYFACAWAGRYPASKDAAWLEVLAP